jgi:hypothetical protein
MIGDWSVGQIKAHMTALKASGRLQELCELHALHLSHAEQGHLAVLLGTSRSFNMFVVEIFAGFSPSISQQVIEYAQHLYVRDGVVGEMQVEGLLLEAAFMLDFFKAIEHVEMFPTEFQSILLENGCPLLANLKDFDPRPVVNAQQSYDKGPVRCLRGLQLMSRADRQIAMEPIEDHGLASLVVRFGLVAHEDLHSINNELIHSAMLERDLL